MDLERGIAACADVEPEVEGADEGLDEGEDFHEEAAEIAANGQLPQHIQRLHALVCLCIFEQRLQGRALSKATHSAQHKSSAKCI